MYPSRIFLVGMPASGKTTLGKQLATKLRYQFFDTDKELEKIYGATIKSIIRQHGINEFRIREKNLFAEINKLEKTVIATGGGMPTYDDNMKQMKISGVVIWLEPSVKELCERIKNKKSHRPLLEKITDEQMPGFLENLFNERKIFYERSHLIFRNDKIGVSLIMDALKNF